MKNAYRVLAIALAAAIGFSMTACAELLTAMLAEDGSGRSNKRYEVVNQSISWTDARREAERRGGYLCVITSAAEQKKIEDMVTSSGGKRGYWIGGYCDSDRVFKWVNGERMSYKNWGPGEPNNAGGTQDKMVFVHQPYTTGGNRVTFGYWDDDRNNINDYGFIVEWD